MRRVLGFGTYDTRSHPRVRVLLEGLSDTPDVEVRELNEPLGLSTADRVAMLKQPWRLPLLVTRLASRWSFLAGGSRVYRGSASPDAVLVGYMGHFDVLLARVLYPRTTIILDHLISAAGTARDRGEGGAKARILSILDEIATRSADVVVVDTQEHLDLLAPGRRAHGVVIPVGAPDNWYEAGAIAGRRRQTRGESTTIRPLSVIFFGLFTPLQGAPTIAEALRLLEERGIPLQITLVGSGQDRAECENILSEVTSVTWIDWVDAADLPTLVADHDVCLGIAGTTPKALNVVPNKVFQGLAAGCAVVTSDTPPQRRVLGQGAVYFPPGDASALADRLAQLAGSTQALTTAKEQAARTAQAFTASKVVLPLLDFLTQSGDKR